jgi:hypothetical protein
MCFDWYKTKYSPAIESMVWSYCDRFGKYDDKGVRIIPVPYDPNPASGAPPLDKHWADVSQDCLCTLRNQTKEYRDLREFMGVVYQDACWYTPCTPDSVQLKSDVLMFNPACPTTICQNIVNIIDTKDLGDDSSGNEINYYIQQSVNCAPSGSTTSELTKMNTDKFQRTIKFILYFILVVFVILVLAIGISSIL